MRLKWLLPAMLILPSVAHGADCPTAADAKTGLRLERAGIVSEVRSRSDLIVEITTAFLDGERQTIYYFRGLIELYRTGASKPFVAATLSDLRSVVPLKKGQRRKYTYIPIVAGGSAGKPETVELHAVGSQDLTIGNCAYKVVQVKSRILASDAGAASQPTALYSAELGVILARRYDEGTSKEETIAYESIKALSD